MWREALLQRFGGGGFAGITMGRWLRVLRDNHFAVDRPYWGKAAMITLASIPNTLLGAWENLWYRRRVRNTKIDPPLFILGIWRSGTTHLHNLLAQDGRWPRGGDALLLKDIHDGRASTIASTPPKSRPVAWRHVLKPCRFGLNLKTLSTHNLGSTGSLSSARTPKTHSWTLRSGSLRTNLSSPSMPRANSPSARDHL
jgi:hypothetical protein